MLSTPHTNAPRKQQSGLHADAVERWAAWLARPEARCESSGMWWSWCNPDHPGYPYEEATAWVLRVAALLRSAGRGQALVDLGDEAAARLRAVALQRGGLGRGGRVYTFDTGVGLSALLRWSGPSAATQALSETLHQRLQAGVAVSGGPSFGSEMAETRWSEAFGPHLLWLAEPLQLQGDERRAEELLERLAPLANPAGAWPKSARNPEVYHHAMAYALWGLRWLEPASPLARVLRQRGVAALQNQITEQGLIPARPHDPKAPLRLDATAQLATLMASDAPAAARALVEGLVPRTAHSGGLPYQPGSGDWNAWVTSFAIEAALRGLDDAGLDEANRAPTASRRTIEGP